jgi:hypothetical protein
MNVGNLVSITLSVVCVGAEEETGLGEVGKLRVRESRAAPGEGPTRSRKSIGIRLYPTPGANNAVPSRSAIIALLASVLLSEELGGRSTLGSFEERWIACNFARVNCGKSISTYRVIDEERFGSLWYQGRDRVLRFVREEIGAENDPFGRLTLNRQNRSSLPAPKLITCTPFPFPFSSPCMRMKSTRWSSMQVHLKVVPMLITGGRRAAAWLNVGTASAFPFVASDERMLQVFLDLASALASSAV